MVGTGERDEIYEYCGRGAGVMYLGMWNSDGYISYKL